MENTYNMVQLLVDYKAYWIKMNNEESKKGVPKMEPDTYRKCINDIMSCIGFNPIYLKKDFKKTGEFLFPIEDKELIFKMFYEYVDVKEIRKREFLNASPEKISFYINSFIKILKSLGVSDKIINEQRDSMEKVTCYKYICEKDNMKASFDSFSKELEDMLRNDDSLFYDDYIELIKYCTFQIDKFKELIKDVYFMINIERSHERAKSTGDYIRSMSEKELDDFKADLSETFKVEECLRKNEQFNKLSSELNEIALEGGFYKHQEKKMRNIKKELKGIEGFEQLENLNEKMSSNSPSYELVSSDKMLKNIVNQRLHPTKILDENLLYKFTVKAKKANWMYKDICKDIGEDSLEIEWKWYDTGNTEELEVIFNTLPEVHQDVFEGLLDKVGENKEIDKFFKEIENLSELIKTNPNEKEKYSEKITTLRNKIFKISYSIMKEYVNFEI